MTGLQMACTSRVVIILALIAFTGWMVSLDQHIWAAIGFGQSLIASLAPVKAWEDTPAEKPEDKPVVQTV